MHGFTFVRCLITPHCQSVSWQVRQIDGLVLCQRLILGCLGSNEVSPQIVIDFGVPGVERSEPPAHDLLGVRCAQPQAPNLNSPL
jgi:hypothetical protein